MTPRRVDPRTQQPSLFDRWEAPVPTWDQIPEEIRQEVLRLLTQLFRQRLQNNGGVRARKEVTDE